MAHNSAGDSPEPDETGGGVPDSPEYWGNNGLVGNGRYRLTRRLGRGGMAEVFAAEDVRLGRTVAVKLLRSDLAEDPVSKARFTREAQSVAGLNHHAVVAVYDSGEDFTPNNGTVSYIVMELVEGHTIRDLLLSAEPPPPDQALIIVSGVLEALAYSHQHGIVHRDIKPGNVIITNGGAVKVMDFGIARALHGAQNTMTQTGMVMGTPQYLSPEQALGRTIDTRSDLYAVGCLLYELLAQRPPFVGETPLSVVYQHVQDQARPPSEICETAPPELDGLVMRSLAKEPDDRFQTAEEMRGLVQYGLRMLLEQGGHTGGLWNTGPVSSGTPAMGTRAASGGTGTPPQGNRMIPHRDEDSGGYPGGHRDDARGGSWKIALIAVCAVLAVTAGILFAVRGNDDPGDEQKPPATSSSPATTDEETSQEPTTPSPDDPSTEPEEESDWTPDPEPTSQEPSEPQTSSTPPPTQPSDSPTNSDDGSSSEGSIEGNTNEGSVEGGANEGTSEGSTDEGNTNEGSVEGSIEGADSGQTSGEIVGGNEAGGDSGGN